jgi:hypothetical protein
MALNLRGLFDDVGGMLGAQPAPVTQSAGLINPHTGQPVSFTPLWGNTESDPRNWGQLDQLQPFLEQAGVWDQFRGTSEAPPSVPAGYAGGNRGENTGAYNTYTDWLGGLNWDALNGYGMGDSRQDYYVTKHLQTPEGQIISGDPVYDRESWNTDDYLNLAAKAALIYGGGLGFDSLMAGAGVGGATAGAAEGLGTLGTIEAGSGAVASLPTMAELGLGAATVPTIPTTAAIGGGAIGGGLGMLGTIPAGAGEVAALPTMAEAGLGAATMPVVPEVASFGGVGMLGTLPEVPPPVDPLPTNAEAGIAPAVVPTIPAVPAVTESGGLLDYLKANPRLVAGLAGGLLGGAGGSGSGGYSYSGPMPTITRGGWKPTATPTYSAPAAAPLLNTKPGQANSGLWRYMLGGGQ